MTKTILITGATDGIGLATAHRLAAEGHRLVIHGRSGDKLQRVSEDLRSIAGHGGIETWISDFANLRDVVRMADELTAHGVRIDVLINNAGVYKTASPMTADGLDVRFVVNTLAPALLTQRLLPLLSASSRVVTLSSAAQAPVDIGALTGETRLADMDAYAQSKLAVTMWSAAMAKKQGAGGPVFVSVNPGSLLASKMVRDGFGVAGKDIGIGAAILAEAATGDRFSDANGRYFDNDSGAFAPPHPDASDAAKTAAVCAAIDELIAPHLSQNI